MNSAQLIRSQTNSEVMVDTTLVSGHVCTYMHVWSADTYVHTHTHTLACMTYMLHVHTNDYAHINTPNTSTLHTLHALNANRHI